MRAKFGLLASVLTLGAFLDVVTALSRHRFLDRFPLTRAWLSSIGPSGVDVLLLCLALVACSLAVTHRRSLLGAILTVAVLLSATGVISQVAALSIQRPRNLHAAISTSKTIWIAVAAILLTLLTARLWRQESPASSAPALAEV